MKAPKNSDVHFQPTDDGDLELQVTAALRTRAEAAELIACIKHRALALPTEPRPRKPRAPRPVVVAS